MIAHLSFIIVSFQIAFIIFPVSPLSITFHSGLICVFHLLFIGKVNETSNSSILFDILFLESIFISLMVFSQFVGLKEIHCPSYLLFVKSQKGHESG
jgi:hypothetical protein